MVYTPFLVAFAALTSSVHGHYSFMRVAVNGKWAAPLQYVRNHTHDYWESSTPGGYSNRPRTYDWWINPVDRPESVRCGRDNMAWAKETEVLKVHVSDELEFSALSGTPFEWTDENFNNCPEGQGTCSRPGNNSPYPWYHAGPVVVHISRVPDGEDVRTYDGAGEWVKIYTLGLEFQEGAKPAPLRWLPRKVGQYESTELPGRVAFKLPKETPKGQYLIRAASIYPSTFWTYNDTTTHGEVQLYHSCAQIQVDSDATGSLPKGVLIPEAFQYGKSGLVVSVEMYDEKKVDADYLYPGGPLWTGKELVEDKPVL